MEIKHDYKRLIVWQNSMELAKQVYNMINLLPKEETYALSDQIRRAVVSVPSNIAEGFGRISYKEIKHFLSIARGSLFELETQLLLCIDFNFISKETVRNTFELIDSISRMLFKLINRLSNE